MSRKSETWDRRTYRRGLTLNAATQGGLHNNITNHRLTVQW